MNNSIFLKFIIRVFKKSCIMIGCGTTLLLIVGLIIFAVFTADTNELFYNSFVLILIWIAVTAGLIIISLAIATLLYFYGTKIKKLDPQKTAEAIEKGVANGIVEGFTN